MSENNNEKKKYPVQPYIIGLLIAVVTIVLLSYFVQRRNSNQQMSEYGQLHSTQIEEINQRIDALETRISILEKDSNR